MATTYDRLRVALRRLKRRTTWDLTELAESIREGQPRPEEFRVRGEGTSLDDYMKVSSIRRLLTLLVELELADGLPENKIRINSAGDNCLQSDDRFANQIKSSVTTLLHRAGIEIEDVRLAIKQIQLPDIPDADNILAKVSENAQKAVRVYYRFDNDE